MRVLITGSTGLIGSHLSDVLSSEGHNVIGLSRTQQRTVSRTGSQLSWDLQSGPLPATAFEAVDAIVHLAGEPIAAKRWSTEQKRRIRDSRIVGTRNLVEGLRSLNQRPGVLICGSAVGYYGNRGDESLDESAPAGNDFLAELCQEWEREAMRAAELGMRVALIRTGVVLSPAGGALKKMLPAFKAGVAGPLGDGRQWFPWIHIEDEVGLLRFVLLSASIDGPINAVAPGVVTNAEFTKQLAGVLHRPAFLPAPAFALRIAFGEMADALLGSQRVIPKAAIDAGYSFQYPELGKALEELLGSTAVGKKVGSSGN